MYIVRFKYYYKAFCSPRTLVLRVLIYLLGPQVEGLLQYTFFSVEFYRTHCERQCLMWMCQHTIFAETIFLLYIVHISVCIYIICCLLYTYIYLFFFTSCFECWMTFWVDFLNICFQHLYFKCFYFFL